MRLLYDEFKKCKRSYYNVNINVEALFDAGNCHTNCKAFIDKHFEIGHKKRVLTITDKYKEYYQYEGKHIHTVSLYLLGLLFRGVFCGILKKKIGSIIPLSECWYDYKYTWYLTCLTHDIASAIERHTGFLEETYNVQNSTLFNNEWNLLRFERETIINYLEYIKKCNKLEHGIFGGTQIFDSLRCSFEEKTRGHDWKANPVYSEGDLNWRLEHLEHFAYVADAVCCHNIWLATTEDVKRTYKENNLDELCVYQESDKLSLKEYPLQFMLCLLDTIEPTKKFSDISPAEVLKNIYVDIKKSKITLAFTDLIKEHRNFHVWIDSIQKMSDWMQVDVLPCSCNNNLCTINIILKE